eukprot:SAG31_NODE_19528_length_599_cov_1.130000_1_plen_59_part_01
MHFSHIDVVLSVVVHGFTRVPRFREICMMYVMRNDFSFPAVHSGGGGAHARGLERRAF